MNRGRFCKRLFCWDFVIDTAMEPKHSFCSRTSFHSRAVSHMKIANVYVGTIHQNVKIALQFTYQFAIFISVCNFHISLQFSRFGVYFLRGSLQFSYEFAIFIWVCNFHLSLQFSRHDSSTYLGFGWILWHYDIELINSMSATVLRVRQTKFKLRKIDYYLLFKSS